MMPSIPAREENTGGASQPPPSHEDQSPLVKAQRARGEGGMAVYYFGTVVWVTGVLLIIGNVSGKFRTLPFAGFLTTVVGVLIQSRGNAIVKASNARIQAELFAEVVRRQAVAEGKSNAPSAFGIGAGAAAPQQADSVSNRGRGMRLVVILLVLISVLAIVFLVLPRLSG